MEGGGEEMLDELFPIQFVEGINESAEVVGDGFLQVRQYDRIAIPLAPTMAFTISRVEISLIWGRFGTQETYAAKISFDHDNNPSEIALSEGELIFEPTDSGYGWCKIKLVHPVVLLPNKHYWLELESKDALFHLGIAREGARVSMRADLGEGWSSSGNDHSFMLRLYGRVFPTIC